jgi:anti-sigma factor RsiW
MTDNPHPEFLPLIVRAADGRLEPADQQALDAHVATCARCAEALADQVASRAALQAMPRQNASAFFAARVRARLTASQPRRPVSWSDLGDFRKWTMRLGTLTAALAIVIAVASNRSESEATDGGSVELAAEELPASAALWSESVSDTGLLAILLQASPDDSLSDALAETSR